MQPPEPIEHYPAESVPVTWESLLAWRTSEGFERTRTILTQYPKEALLGLESRLLLYHLIRSTKPMTVVEIGTYFAGTAELMTRALWENGKGGLTTVDPFGGQRCQAIIDTWPEPLRKHVQFAALDSMQLMIAVEHQRTLIDFAFVDGNHEYEYAYFDIANCARFMRPGGFIVVDDVDQIGPFLAIRDFLARTPGWTTLGQSSEWYNEGDAFDLDRRAPFEGSAVALVAPTTIWVGREPYTTGPLAYSERTIERVALTLTNDAPPGTLDVMAILRGFNLPGQARKTQQVSDRRTIRLDGQRTVEVVFDPALETEVHPFHHSSEIALIWKPDVAGALELESPPTPLPHT